MGRRVKKAVYAYGSGAWELEKEILFVYDGWNLIQEKEVSATGDPLFDKFYVWGLDLSQSLQGAGGIGGLVCRVVGGEVRHYLYDANGNVGQLVNPADGAVTARYEYDPFGNAVFMDGADAAGNAFRFSTKYWDGETRLAYYGLRYYSAELGRWFNRDPIRETGGRNLYLFTGNNSIIYIDLLGLFQNSSKFVEPVIRKVYQHGNNVLFRIIAGSFVTHILAKIPHAAAITVSFSGGYLITSWAIEDTWLDGGIGAAAYDLQEAVRKTLSSERIKSPQIPLPNNSSQVLVINENIDESSEVVLQIHHFATNKHQKYTPEFEEIVCKYNLELDESWNKDLLPHLGRHPDPYHDWMLDQFLMADSIAAGEKEMFVKILNEGAFETVRNNPEMLHKDYWR